MAEMEKHPQSIFLTDDCAARLVATQFGFKVHGTIGIILRAIRISQIKPQEVIRIFSRIPDRSTLYIKPSMLEEIIRKVKEEFEL